MMQRILVFLLMALVTMLVAAPTASANEEGPATTAIELISENGNEDQILTTTTTAKSVAITIWVPTTTALFMTKDEDTEAATTREDVAIQIMRPTMVVTEVDHALKCPTEVAILKGPAVSLLMGADKDRGQNLEEVALMIVGYEGSNVASPPTAVALVMIGANGETAGSEEELVITVLHEVAIEVGCTPNAEVAPLGAEIYLGFIHADEGTESSNLDEQALTCVNHPTMTAAAPRLLMNSA